jgi:myo-inositol-1(or 4)-monophosphatase
MEERLKGSLVRAVQGAGMHLTNRNGGRKTLYELERRCAERMRSELRSAEPSVSFLGEGDDDGKAFAICPLDSTLNYSSGFGSFGVMAAYMEGGEPLLGALHMPLEGITITAERGKGARSEGRKISAGGSGDLRRAIVCCECTAYLHEGGRDVPLFTAMLEALSRAGVPWRNTGSPAQAYASLAMGMTDGFLSPLREGTHAAGYLVMREAGAVITDGRGNRFSMASAGIVAAGRQLHGQLLEAVTGALR